MTTFAELLAPIASRELNKSYSTPPPQWRPLGPIRRDTTYFGRKRRARRARGRRIEQRRSRPYSSATLAWMALQAVKLKSFAVTSDRGLWVDPLKACGFRPANDES